MMIHKSREVQKTTWKADKVMGVFVHVQRSKENIWKAHKLMGIKHKSREVQKTIWKALKVMGMIYKSREEAETCIDCPQGDDSDVQVQRGT